MATGALWRLIALEVDVALGKTRIKQVSDVVVIILREEAPLVFV